MNKAVAPRRTGPALAGDLIHRYRDAAMAVGFLVFMLRQNDELGWGITTFGLGIIALGRQQYDQYVQVLAGAGALRGSNVPESPPDAV